MKKENKQIEKAEKSRENKLEIKSEKPVSRRIIIFGFILGIVVSIVVFLINNNYILAIILFFSIILLFSVYVYLRARLKQAERIRKMEEVFPDFLQLMSSNLRAGITIDRAMLLSSRPEFYPLDSEIQRAGRDITTGKEIEVTLLDMSKRINSEKIYKTILLIISGIKAGGNLAVLLEETAVNIRERDFVEKRAASNVLMYVIFIFVAVAVGAPILFSLSSVLVQILGNLLGGLPAANASVSLPFTLSKVNVPLDFIIYFSLTFMIIIDILASLILGLVSNGEERRGVKYIIPLLAISIGIFFIMRIILTRFMSGFF